MSSEGHLHLFDGDVGAEPRDDFDVVELLQDLLHQQTLQHLRVPHVVEQSEGKDDNKIVKYGISSGYDG